MRLRTGLHTGEAQIEHGDYFGAALSRAARLRALGRAVRCWSRRPPPSSSPIGSRPASRCATSAVQLRGFERAEQVHQMCAPFLPDDGGPDRACGPETEARRASVPDRAPAGCHPVRRPRRRARGAPNAWTRAVDTSQRRLVLVGGDPGIGKSRPPPSSPRRLRQGLDVLFGRCYEENVVPYQPFVEAVEQYLSTEIPPRSAPTSCAAARSSLAWSPTSACGSPTPEPIRAEPDTERYLMFEAVDALLAGIAKRAPLLLVLDDLHWADRPTLALLSHSPGKSMRRRSAARHLSHERGGRRPSAARIIADLRHDGVAEDIALGGLSEARSGSSSTRATSSRGPVSCTASGATAGNPFFVQEICSHVGETGATAGAFTLEALGVPEGVKEVIGRRIARLPRAPNVS